VYSVFTRLGDGEFLYVASRDELVQAVQLADALNESWPGEYEVRDSHGNRVDLVEKRSMESERENVSPNT
jgi:hypothetical protein